VTDYDGPEPQSLERLSGIETSDPLAPWARVVALVLGCAGGVAGGIAVFVSANQAGTGALLVIAGVLVLLGLQGTPMRRLSSGDHSVELAQLRRRAVRVIEQARQEDPPEVAVAVADAITSIDPSLGGIHDAAQAYERAVLEALARIRMKLDPGHKRGKGSRGVDARVITPSGSVNLDIKYRSRGPMGLREVLARMARAESGGLEGGSILVTNAPLSDEVREYNESRPPEDLPVEIVTWNDERDDGLLTRAIARNLR
jgi:hypothetical protein